MGNPSGTSEMLLSVFKWKQAIPLSLLSHELPIIVNENSYNDSLIKLKWCSNP